jgi:hypothetical protein
MRGIILLCTLLCAAEAASQPLLLPPNLAGAIGLEEANAFVSAFVAEIERRTGAPVERVVGDPCPMPVACGVPGRAPVYWVQLSGDEGRRVALAMRLDGEGAVEARRTGEATAGQLSPLGTELGAAVAAGEATGLEVSTGRLRGADVYLDDALLGRTPLMSDEPLDAGQHVVRVQTADGRTALAMVQARHGERAVLELDFSAVPRGSQRRVGAWPLLPALAGGAVAAILIATDPAGIIGPDHRVTVVPP